MIAPSVTKKRSRLTGLKLHEISLVDRPANQHATVALFKRDTPPVVTVDTLNAAVAALKASTAALAKSQVAPVNVLHARAATALHLLGDGGDGATVLLNRIDKSASHDLTAFLQKRADPVRTRLADLVITWATSENSLSRKIAETCLTRERPDIAAVVRGN